MCHTNSDLAILSEGFVDGESSDATHVSNNNVRDQDGRIFVLLTVLTVIKVFLREDIDGDSEFKKLWLWDGWLDQIGNAHRLFSKNQL